MEYYCIVEIQDDYIMGVFAPYDNIIEAVKHVEKLEAHYKANGVDMTKNKLTIVRTFRPDFMPE